MGWIDLFCILEKLGKYRPGFPRQALLWFYAQTKEVFFDQIPKTKTKKS